jgi:hypothetical protein
LTLARARVYRRESGTEIMAPNDWVRSLAMAGSIVLVAGGDARGLVPSETRCLAAKARAAANVIERVAACHAKNVLAGGTAGPDCFVRATFRLPEALARADGVGPCGGDHGYLAELAQSHCIAVLDGFDRCNADKIRATGDLAAGLVRCLGRAGGVADAACVEKRRARYLSAFARAERNGPCPGGPEYFSQIVDGCVADFARALRCGNDRIDRGEECDGQIFCTTRECRIRVEISCCQFGTPPNAVCADVFPEMCFAAGFQVASGFCAGEPAPQFCSGCRVGGCVDPPIAETSVCCEQGTTCQATTVASTVGLATELHRCVQGGGQPFLATCSAGGRCSN